MAVVTQNKNNGGTVPSGLSGGAALVKLGIGTNWELNLTCGIEGAWVLIPWGFGRDTAARYVGGGALDP